MKTIELNDTLEKLINVSGYRSILIDGPWGCGKTYEIKKFLNNHKRKCVYVSVFGLETINEINAEIYRRSHKVSLFFKKSLNSISKVTAPIKYVGNITEALSYQLNNIDASKIKKFKIVILDDIERLSEAINYKDLVGYINRLFLSECRVVCIASLSSLQSETNKERLRDFQAFREKVFDGFICINNISTETLDSIFSDLNISDIKEAYPLFENNVRLASNVKRFYLDIKKEMATDKKFRISDFELFKICIFTTKCVLLNHPEKPVLKDTKQSFPSFYYDSLVSEFGENTTNGVYKYFPNKTGYELKENCISYLKDYVIKLIPYYLYRDSREFIGYSEVHEQKNTDNMLDRSIFYLSEENKKIYFDKVCSFIKENKQFDKRIAEWIRGIYAEYSEPLPEDLIRLIAKSYFSNKPSFSCDTTYLTFEIFPGGIPKEEKYQTFIETFKEEYLKLCSEYLINTIQSYFENCEYDKLVDLFDKNKSIKNIFIEKLLFENNFYIPDLSCDLDESLWTLCHVIAELSKNYKIEEQYVNAIKNTYKNATNKTDTLITRLWALVYYKVDNAFTKKDLLN